ncbi:TPA: class I SAM-dependent methyltransferase, partial [Staphylococcus aureus]|nr:class I SAM-dependent methyltransferase [Staphylococcus aureus]
NEYNYFDYYKKRWGFFGYCRYIPYLKKRLNNKIVIMEYKVPN